MPIIAPGYLLTWHTYGTWLHGDDAGSVDVEHNRFSTPRLAADPMRFQRELAALKHPPFVLLPLARTLVESVMREHCRIRAWQLLALAVRSNHVHVLIGVPSVEPEIIVKQLKEWGTRRLRSHRIAGPQQRVWADHASTEYLYEKGSVDSAMDYVLRMQDSVSQERSRPDWDKKLAIREP